MQFVTVFFNRKSQTHLDLEQQFEELLKSGPFVSLSAADTEISGKTMFGALQDESSSAKQSVKIFSIDQVHAVAAQMNEFVSKLEKSVKVKAINLLPQGGLRALGYVLTEELVEVTTSDGTRKTAAPRRSLKQNPAANAATDSGTEGSSVS
jgi:hypothetical protein